MYLFLRVISAFLYLPAGSIFYIGLWLASLYVSPLARKVRAWVSLRFCILVRLNRSGPLICKEGAPSCRAFLLPVVPVVRAPSAFSFLLKWIPPIGAAASKRLKLKCTNGLNHLEKGTRTQTTDPGHAAKELAFD